MENNVVPPLVMTAVTALCGLVYARRRRSAGVKAALAAGCSVWGAAQVLIFMVPHTAAVTITRITGQSKPMSLMSIKVAGFEYDFRLYSLVLLGTLFIAQAVRILRASRAASDGDLPASKRVRRSVWNVLLLATPLAPISPGIPFLTAPAVCALLSQYLLFASKRQLEISPASAQPSSVTLS